MKRTIILCFAAAMLALLCACSITLEGSVTSKSTTEAAQTTAAQTTAAQTTTAQTTASDHLTDASDPRSQKSTPRVCSASAAM